MRWEQEDPPAIGSVRTVRRFIWRRTVLLGEGRWGQWAHIRQVVVRERWWHLRGAWKSIRWADGPADTVEPETEDYPSLTETEKVRILERWDKCVNDDKLKLVLPLSDKEAAGLSPEIVKTVTLLRQWGYETTDSGDGSQHTQGMGCAVPCPMIAIELGPTTFSLQVEADKLRDRLVEIGVQMDTYKDSTLGQVRSVQASYDTADCKQILILTGVTDRDLP